MMGKEQLDLVDHLISEIDDLEPKYIHYKHYLQELKNDASVQSSNYRKVLLRRL